VNQPLNDNLSGAQVVRKTVIATEHGVVASQHKKAAQVGAAVLAAGGDAVDAAVATSFALGVVEPWMSGAMAGGCMVLWRAGEKKAHVVDYGMRSPRGLDPADYPLSGEGRSSDLFPWKAVVGDRNVQGATAVAVPGVVSGMGLAHERFGTKAWRDLVCPPSSWRRKACWSTGTRASSPRPAPRPCRSIRMPPRCSSTKAPGPSWARGPAAPSATSTSARWPPRCSRSPTAGRARCTKARSPRRWPATSRPRAAAGRSRPRRLPGEWADPLEVPYRGGRVFAAPGLTGGPTFAQALRALEGELQPGNGPDARAYQAMARTLDAAFRTRLSDMGDHESPKAPPCTTHFSVVDRHGNMCSVTQTLLSIFGSRVVSPSTGLLLNNGIMWFDPEPGQAELAGAGQARAGQLLPGGGRRRRRPPVRGGRLGRPQDPGRGDATQLVPAGPRHDAGAGVPPAAHRRQRRRPGHRRPGAGPDILQALAQVMPVVPARRMVFPYLFACPAGVMRHGGRNMGCTEIMSPWGDAVAGVPT
jgi:gamma-glutamyltranspeptidase/glutathione hydrolase